MALALFLYNGIETKIHCNIDEKMSSIINKFIFKSKIDVNKAQFLYNGNQINFNLTFFEQANQIDKQRKIMSILVYDNNTLKISVNEGIISSKEVICPKCKENCLIDIKNYKIRLFNCKNGHEFNNILLSEFYNLQNINENEIKCNNCNNTKNKVYNKQFYKCINCKINLCPLCSQKHKTHELLDYNNIHYFCSDHKDFYVSYCLDCKTNLCLKCEMKHNKSHQIISFNNIFPDEEQIKEDMKNFRIKIDKFKENITKMINILNNVSKNIERYYKIIYEILYNYNSRQRNYEILQNINSIANFIKLKDIELILNEQYNNESKIKILFNIYNEMNYKSTDNEIISDIRISNRNPLYFEKDEKEKFTNININFLYQGKSSIIKSDINNMFAEVALNFCWKEGIQENEKLLFIYNNNEIEIASPKTIGELNIYNNSTIQVIKKEYITLIFYYQGKNYSIQSDIRELFKNAALKFSELLGKNIDDISFYYNASNANKYFNKTLEELGLKNFATFNVVDY